MRTTAYLILLLFVVTACQKETEITPEIGAWRAELLVQDDKALPFNFSLKEDRTIEVYNAEEIIEVDEVTIKDDSIFIKMPVFEGYIAAKLDDAKHISGSFIKESLDRVVPFTAEHGHTERFSQQNNAASDISGNWETVFSPDVEADRYIAKGIFSQKGDKVIGTFRTTTGDYRYLEGILDGDQLQLSTFDGAHAFLFMATVTDSTMNGHFYSGNHWKEPFTAKRNESYELPDENTLTYLKEGYETLEFSFPDASGNMISLQDEQFKDKVVIVQVMGTWCPNCLDESKYYTAYYNDKKPKNVEFVSLAFEYAKTKEQAFDRIKRLKNRLNIPYPILLAQFGTSDKGKANEKLPMLNHVLSYPTTIFIDKKGNVRKIHTGFNGPATGDKYLQFKTEFEKFAQELSEEE